MECLLEKATVHYEQFGEGKPIIFLHGQPVDHRHMVKDFEPIFEKRDGWKRIYPDMPGMGETPGPKWVTCQDQMLDIMLEFIDALFPNQHFCVAGTSFGGYMAQGLVYRRPQMIDGALFMTPVAGMTHEMRDLPDHVILVEDRELMLELETEEADFFRGFAVVQNRELLESIRRDVVPAIEVADHHFLDVVAKQYLFSFDVGKLQSPFEKPVLFLLGRQDSVVGFRDAWQVLDNYPRASFVVLDRAGHGMGVEQKDLFEILTQEWLDRVEESARMSTEGNEVFE